jgi:hypothetical protein
MSARMDKEAACSPCRRSLAQIEAKAKSEGKTVDEVACQALTDGLHDDRWHRLVAFGLENGRKSGFREDQVVDIIHEWRAENRLR